MYVLKTPCTAAPKFGARRIVIRFASCGGCLGTIVDLHVSWRILDGSWQILEACGVLRGRRFEKLRVELSVPCYMFLGSCFASTLQFCFKNI